MGNPDLKPDENGTSQEKLKIYFLPNLMTAGNLFCGFLAMTKIVEADPLLADFPTIIRHALFFILLACIFDLLDGRVARMGGNESPFGREFDSLADIISFGAAPAFLVHRVVLRDSFINYPQVGWFIASIYLICGAFRLARFNCLAVMPGGKGGGGSEFLGFPIPAAAGLVASLTLFLLWLEDKNFTTGYGKYALPVIMVFLSMMMVSQVKYPTFKKIDFRTRRTFPKMIIIVLLLGCFILFWKAFLHFVLPILFTAYLLYGFIRPRISRKIRQDIEDEDEEDDEKSGMANS
ncbi:MAG: CDP-diacylglycerol--serine O-phosphatidyltransferase [Verrucomicrobiota bacterium]